MARFEHGVPDLVLLEDISEEAILDTLRKRFKADKVYSNIGSVLVAVNPFKRINIYGDEQIRDYHGSPLYELEPHVFAVGDEAYREMKNRLQDQCVVISGESGAGKTVSAKFVMQYVAQVSGRSDHGHRVKDQLLNSNPVLEAWGNAKTNRNDNSSRFGKYMDMQFDFKADPIGGHITNYLLEKGRVVLQEKGERNFHIFYFLLAGAPDGMLGELLIKGTTAEDYACLRKGESIKVGTLDDKALYKEMYEGMKVVGFSEADALGYFKYAAAIMHLSNVVFEPVDDHHCTVKRDGAALSSAAALLQVEEAALVEALTNRTLTTREGNVQSPLNAEQARYSRDALCKNIYSRTFDDIIRKVNEFVNCPEKDRRNVIGVLDIYGFEIFEKNSFEQFCINFCNEKLQQLFIELTLKREQEEYQREGLQWVEIDYFNNGVICSLIEQAPGGIISLLDEQCLMQADDDRQFLAKLVSSHTSHAHFEVGKMGGSSKFTLKHYAGDVEYDSEGFIDKNKDTLFKDLARLMFGSQSDTSRRLFPEGGLSDAELMKRPVTAATQFKKQVNELAATLMTKEPHYIRCIKSNDEKRAGTFADDICKHQVRYLGLLENVRVRRAGFCFRQKYTVFLDRYKTLCPDTWPQWGPPEKWANTDNEHAKVGVEKLMLHCGFQKGDFELGKSKLFVKDPRSVFRLEDLREGRVQLTTAKVQARFRGWRQKREYQNIRNMTLRVQSNWKRFVFRKRYEKLRRMFIGWLALRYNGDLEKYNLEWMTGEERAMIKELVRQRKASKSLVLAFKRHFIRQTLHRIRDAITTSERSGVVRGQRYAMGKWPTSKVTWMKKTIETLQAMWPLWVAHKYRALLSPEQKWAMDEKLFASELFLGEKSSYPASVPEPFVAGKDKLAEFDPKMARQWASLFPDLDGANDGAGQKQEVLYAMLLVKLNRSDYKPARRIWVLCTSCIYVLDAQLKVKSHIPFEALSSVSVSPHTDNLFVVHIDAKELDKKDKKKGDFLFMAGDHVELITKLAMQYKKVTQFSFKVNFKKEILFNLKGDKQQRIMFEISADVVEQQQKKLKKDLVLVLPKDDENKMAQETENALRKSMKVKKSNGDNEDMGLNEAQLHKFMRDGTLPRGFDFKKQLAENGLGEVGEEGEEED